MSYPRIIEYAAYIFQGPGGKPHRGPRRKRSGRRPGMDDPDMDDPDAWDDEDYEGREQSSS